MMVPQLRTFRFGSCLMSNPSVFKGIGVANERVSTLKLDAPGVGKKGE